jgi:hypothetical protein
MLEVARQNFVGELFWIFKPEEGAIVRPMDITRTNVLGVMHNIIQLEYKRHGVLRSVSFVNYGAHALRVSFVMFVALRCCAKQDEK